MSARYSLNRKDRKLAGVCSTIGKIFNIDPTFIRIGFVAAAFLISFKLALIAYAAAWIYLHMARRSALRGKASLSEFNRMEQSGKGRASIHDLRNLDANGRRMMAIDHHLNSQNDDLAREIEALREGK